MPKQTLEERFWAKVDRRGPDECWEWTAARDDAGYGQFWDPARRTMGLAHRFAFALCVAPLQPKRAGTFGAVGETVCHACDNPPCVNPAHLFLGSQGDNMADMVAKGRNANAVLPGARNPRARMTPSQVAEARASYSGAYGQLAALARRYGVSHGAMSHLLHGRTWRT